MNDAIIEAASVHKTLGAGAGQVEALRGIDLSLQRGELALLMGPSGSGKTTLLLVLGCMLTPTSGSVTICGQPTKDVDKEGLAKLRREHIGFVFQSYHLFPTLTAAQNVQLALDIRGERGRAAVKKSREALAMVGLQNKVHSLPQQLSGGEQQRVAIARAIVANPSAVLADEPTAALDGENGQAIMKILKSIAQERSRAIMVVTHDPRVVPFADRIIHIEDGRLVDANESEYKHLPKVTALKM
ncbi:MAG: ABC transporter ATP-binding protein [Bradyrhizobium sp.]|uniref:ABC transporter ATP-binding protein n=1 Tax=Bradyrhizobium sp. TaxID=376 RepID=UPI0025C37409|nr:ABC transporter ATP-binding protein [Bradyrhizobium sp.]MBI5265181.1 ABC transporter ATP-binding protein [Bradyrhizobium sp.]